MPWEEVTVPTGYNIASMASRIVLKLLMVKAHAVDADVVTAMSSAA